MTSRVRAIHAGFAMLISHGLFEMGDFFGSTFCDIRCQRQMIMDSLLNAVVARDQRDVPGDNQPIVALLRQFLFCVCSF